MYTLEDLERARAELQRRIETFDDVLASCHEQLAAQARDAGRKTRQIEDELRSRGLIEPISGQTPQQLDRGVTVTVQAEMVRDTAAGRANKQALALDLLRRPVCVRTVAALRTLGE